MIKKDREAFALEDDEKNHDFIQFQRKNMAAMRELIKTRPVAAEIFMFLSQYMDQKNALVCSSTILEEVTGKSRSTISRAVAYLKDKQYLTVMKSGTANVFVLNPNVVWSARRNGKSYCEFQGNILISIKENPDLEYKIKKDSKRHLKKIN